jgi:hypothetical protein
MKENRMAKVARKQVMATRKCIAITMALLIAIFTFSINAKVVRADGNVTVADYWSAGGCDIFTLSNGCTAYCIEPDVQPAYVGDEMVPAGGASDAILTVFCNAARVGAGSSEIARGIKYAIGYGSYTELNAPVDFSEYENVWGQLYAVPVGDDGIAFQTVVCGGANVKPLPEKEEETTTEEVTTEEVTTEEVTTEEVTTEEVTTEEVTTEEVTTEEVTTEEVTTEEVTTEETTTEEVTTEEVTTEETTTEEVTTEEVTTEAPKPEKEETTTEEVTTEVQTEQPTTETVTNELPEVTTEETTTEIVPSTVHSKKHAQTGYEFNPNSIWMALVAFISVLGIFLGSFAIYDRKVRGIKKIR